MSTRTNSARATPIAPAQSGWGFGHDQVTNGNKPHPRPLPSAEGRSRHPKALLDQPRATAARIEAREAVVTCFESMLDAGVALGYGRRALADGLGIAEQTVYKWTKSDVREVGGGALMEMLVRRDLLPRPLQLHLLRSIAVRSGFTVTDATEGVCDDADPLPRQLVDIVGAMGRVGERMSNVMDPAGDGGSAMTRTEARQIAELLDRVVEEAVQMRETARRRAGQK